MLGKRKRETVILRRARDTSDDVDQDRTTDDSANDVFRKYFEAQFSPLPEVELKESAAGSDDSDKEDNQIGSDIDGSEWSGISDENAAAVVEVVDYTDSAQAVDDDPISKIFQKSFMNSKPPREASMPRQNAESDKSKAEDEEEDTTNLKHDLDLQRLLRESHLLEQAKKKADNGAQRHKATDLRLQSLGSKASLFTQEKMPMSHRKGMQAKSSSKDAHRRKEARENGIILEKSTKKTSSADSRRQRGVDVPVVGKFKGGTLQLSRKDVASIQGSRRGGTKKRRGR